MVQDNFHPGPNDTNSSEGEFKSDGVDEDYYVQEQDGENLMQKINNKGSTR